MNTDLLRGYIKGDSTQVNFGVTLNTGQHKEDTCNTKARDSNMNRERGSAVVMQTQFFFPPFLFVFCCKHFVNFISRSTRDLFKGRKIQDFYNTVPTQNDHFINIRSSLYKNKTWDISDKYKRQFCFERSEFESSVPTGFCGS